MHWTHEEAVAGLDAYAKFLTLKVLEHDFYESRLRLSPSDLIDKVCLWVEPTPRIRHGVELELDWAGPLLLLCVSLRDGVT